MQDKHRNQGIKRKTKMKKLMIAAMAMAAGAAFADTAIQSANIVG